MKYFQSSRYPLELVLSENIEWSKHPTFDGVELKHIVTAKDTDGLFSYHLVRIAPNCSIKEHIHETQLETHEVISGKGLCINAGEEGLYLFAKFMPLYVRSKKSQ